MVEGPAGVGRTALLADARAMAESAEMQVLTSRGAELEREFAFGVARQLVEPVLRRADDAEDLLRGLSGLDSLTAGERRVAELARDGMTNREIAQSLFVAARTVGGHLTQVFRKLNLSARQQLAEALAPSA
jgi:DNA-binding CsgD family transcriptional regulator